MKKIKLALAPLVLIFPVIATAADPTAADVRAYLESKGGDAAVSKFFSCADDGGFNGFERVASGDKEWVDVGLRVLPSTAACEREVLYSSLAQAMPKAPTLVLPLVTKNNARVACLPLSIGDDDMKSWAPHLARLEKALSRVSQENLQNAKKLCMQEISAARKSLKSGRGM